MQLVSDLIRLQNLLFQHKLIDDKLDDTSIEMFILEQDSFDLNDESERYKITHDFLISLPIKNRILYEGSLEPSVQEYESLIRDIADSSNGLFNIINTTHLEGRAIQITTADSSFTINLGLVSDYLTKEFLDSLLVEVNRCISLSDYYFVVIDDEIMQFLFLPRTLLPLLKEAFNLRIMDNVIVEENEITQFFSLKQTIVASFFGSFPSFAYCLVHNYVQSRKSKYKYLLYSLIPLGSLLFSYLVISLPSTKWDRGIPWLLTTLSFAIAGKLFKNDFNASKVQYLSNWYVLLLIILSLFFLAIIFAIYIATFDF